MKKEHLRVMVVGMYLLSYLLDAVVDPLRLNLASPYDYLSPVYLAQYPFTTTSIVIRSLAIFLTPLLLLSFFRKAYYAKAGTLLVLAVLMQLYAVQDIATDAEVVPLEWALSFSIGGALLLIPALLNLLQGSASAVHQKFKRSVDPYEFEQANAEPEWIEEKPKKAKK